MEMICEAKATSLEQERQRSVSGATLDRRSGLLSRAAFRGGELLGVVSAEGWSTDEGADERDDADDDLRRVNGIFKDGRR